MSAIGSCRSSSVKSARDAIVSVAWSNPASGSPGAALHYVSPPAAAWQATALLRDLLHSRGQPELL